MHGVAGCWGEGRQKSVWEFPSKSLVESHSAHAQDETI